MTDEERVSALERAAAEVTLRLGRASTLMLRALAALEQGEVEELHALLGERQRVLEEAGPFLLWIGQEGEREEGAQAGTQRELAGVLRDLDHAARQLQPEEARLALSLEIERNWLARELDQLHGEEAVLSAYGQGPRQRANINIVR